MHDLARGQQPLRLPQEALRALSAGHRPVLPQRAQLPPCAARSVSPRRGLSDARRRRGSEEASPTLTSPGVLEGADQGGAGGLGLEAVRGGGDHEPAEVGEGEAEVAMEVCEFLGQLAGPGAISAVIVLVGQAQLWWQAIPVFLAILMTSIVTFYLLAAGVRVQRLLGETGTRIMMRLMSLVLAAMAVQFVLNWISDVWLM